MCASLPGQDLHVFSAGLLELLKHTRVSYPTHTFAHTRPSWLVDTGHTGLSVFLSKNFMVMVWLNVSMHSGLALPAQVGLQNGANSVHTHICAHSVGAFRNLIEMLMLCH